MNAQGPAAPPTTLTPVVEAPRTGRRRCTLLWLLLALLLPATVGLLHAVTGGGAL
ncbi:hypothetical protein [Kineococcus sp. SYSU DK002]|uniref:hypothetical protein n=1 Tax=Kineococcus sp. SYSU DK002 TaxID=3383123 RepID=UPI003D7ED90A